ncbi:metalloregulator ArsR/SmtB family transcription factor [Allosaccharopolyspora coralli]|uniref:Metalloregulator ArsR/SmtB family transcription factor n=1 Tax=Allosaccharopolyspora coralli TaxID=2665642 RepID=A0A5Q3QGW0_9PSEU|nr:metalloregulator ArsR/SmtB family transcription factor [Allosaccharopolyspora coralli]QGK70047.1 metalloregulator ArsR/SmtB family transcription factor [Allosaccharopolyspora coralli]
MDLAEAIAGPVRRQILELLRDARLTAGEIAGHFPVSRPAISRHLRVLREAHLVRDVPEGRQRRYVLDSAPLAELADWLAQFDPARTWAQHLETEVHRTRRERRTRPAPSEQKENTA